ncbi:MAG: YggS family pyridoxal phosphate-dependent enzyme [Alphaproteobacteria bacterium]|nr:YggS family pyridoxal phosphate-dependent enzyme [Alphaproteobacteria bacterium]
MTMVSDDVAANLSRVRARIDAAAGPDHDTVTLVAVSKMQPWERVAAALAAGQRAFGENRVQEAQAKWPALREQFQGIDLHLIGPLQTNKVRQAVALFDVIETLDRPKLAHALAEEMAHSGRRIPCLIEVNVGEEPQKAGIMPAALPDFLALCRAQLGLPVAGLMCIPPLDEPAAPHFALLAKLAARHDLAQRSMGMSADFEDAVALGATSVRIGTAVFGERILREQHSEAAIR